MSCHAALGVVKAGVATLKGTGIRINCISPGQIDVGVDLSKADVKGMSMQLPPSSLQSEEVSNSPLQTLGDQLVNLTSQAQKANIGLERSGMPFEVARVAGFLASGFSSYCHGTNMIVDGGAGVMNPLTVPI